MEKTRQHEAAPPSESMNQDSIEELLALAAQSMDQLESQLGGDAEESAVTDEVAPEALDSTLAQVEEELEGLQAQITAEELSGIADAVPEVPIAEEAEDGSIAQADDILSSLALELESLNKNLTDPGEPEAAAPDPTPEASATLESADEESIDDLLNQFSQVADTAEAAVSTETEADESLEELLGSAVSDQPEPDMAAPSAEANPIDDLLNGMAEEPLAPFQPGSQSVVEDALSELSQMSPAPETAVTDEPVDELIDALASEPVLAEPVEETPAAIAPAKIPDTAVQAETPEDNFVHDDLFGGRNKKKKPVSSEPAPAPTLSEDDQLVMAELEQASQGGAPAATVESTESAAENEADQAGPTYAQFTAPQRAVLQTLDAVNRPFQAVPKPANDILGMVAVATLMISMVATALFLLYQ